MTAASRGKRRDKHSIACAQEGHLDVAELLRAAADGSLGGGGRAASALPPAGATRAESPRLGSRGPRWDADEPRRGPECSARAASGSCVSDLFADGDDDANEAQRESGRAGSGGWSGCTSGGLLVRTIALKTEKVARSGAWRKRAAQRPRKISSIQAKARTQ